MPRRSKRIPYKVVGIYDTETTTVRIGDEPVAFPVLFIYNDISRCDISDYRSGRSDDISFYRTPAEFLDRVKRVLDEADGYVPVICAYNLMFDLQPVICDLAQRYEMAATAQSSTNAYTVDILDAATGKPALRFWDVFHLEMNGLAAMGDICGMPKATGSWDYSLIRTPQTELTRDEVHYASRDVQVIPAYLRYLLEANPWMTEDMLGCRVLTKSSIVRQMARREIGGIEIQKRNGKKLKLLRAFQLLCKQELPEDYDSYALRKACFRGGFTFTAARFASLPMPDCVSVDAVSMHHAFINGRRTPVHWMKAPLKALDAACRDIVDTPLDTVLEYYDQPFPKAVHARLRFTNVRLKRGSVFEAYGIALEPRGKFEALAPLDSSGGDNMREISADDAVRSSGYRDVAFGAVFAFGKLYEARECIMHFSELELWAFAQVYDFDSMEALSGEMSIKFIRPPDYVTLQSNILYKRKDAMKGIVSRYRDGEPFDGEIDASIPEHIADEVRAGEADSRFLQSYYQSTVKGSYNSIYGIQAQNVFRPDYKVDLEGHFEIDDSTRVRPDNFEERKPDSTTVLYTHGMRIVGGSRMHMVIAMMLMHRALGERARITGGDTDSMKISLDGAEPCEVIEALAPLHDAIGCAIGHCMARVRRLYPDKAGALTNVGCFEIENPEPYLYNLDAWNKARASVDRQGRYHVTLAGLSRPRGSFHIETFANAMLDSGMDPREVLSLLMGYNLHVCYEVSHSLEHVVPDPAETVSLRIKDHRGCEGCYEGHLSIALYPMARYIGEVMKRANAENISFLDERYGRHPDVADKMITCKKDDDGKILSYALWRDGVKVFETEVL